MKNFIFALGAMSFLLSASCKKSSSSSATANGWKLGATSYTTKFSSASAATKQLIAMDAIPSGSNPAVNDCIVTFSALPASGGTFKIVSAVSGLALGANEITVAGGTYNPGATYLSTGNDGVSATVTVSGGKITVTVPAVWVKKAGGADSLQLSGTLVQQ